MASRRTYECFVCKRQGFDDVQVFLDGKDADGKTKYLNEDMIVHTHQGSSASTQATQPQAQATKEDRILNMLNGLTIKLDRVLALLQEEKENKKE